MRFLRTLERNRQAGATAGTIEIDDEDAVGLCQGGPWDGSERRARAACGRWTLWPAFPGNTG